MYRSVSTIERTPHNDGILIKTRPGIISQVTTNSKVNYNLYFVKPNPAMSELSLIGNLENIQYCRIIDYKGSLIRNDIRNFNTIMISDLIPGLYFLQTIDKENRIHTLKFIKR